MSTSKTTLKNNDVDKNKKVRKPDEGSSTINTKAVVGIAIAVVLVITMVVGIAVENFKPVLAMTISGDKIYMKDVAYYIYEQEANGAYMDSFYQAYYGQSYWDMEGEGGVPNREVAKLAAEQSIEQYSILYKEAVKAGYKITKEDKDSAAKDVEAIRKNLSFEKKNTAGLTKKDLTNVLEKKYCVDRYRKDTIDSFDIDDDKIRDGVKYEDHRQYDIQYYTLPTVETDSETGKEKKLDAKTLEAYKAEMEELAGKATSKNFGTLTEEAKKAIKELEATEPPKESKESDTADKKESKYKSTFTADGKFVKGDGTFTTDFEKAVTKMKNDEVSGVIETDKAYYLVKMVNNDDHETYEAEVKNQITTEENKQFEEWYKKISPKYEVKLNNKEWDKMQMGKTYLD